MAIPILGAIIGREMSREDREKEKQLQERALRDMEELSAPELRQLDNSMYTGLPTNAGGRDYEDEALAGLADVSRTGGLGAQGQLSMEQARLATTARANAANAAIQQNAARRGMGGNASLVAQQVAQQGANQNASLAGMQAAANAENRRLGATQALGGMASQVEGRRQQQLMERARQLDAVNRFQAGLEQQHFQNQLGVADRQYGARQRGAGQYGQHARDTAGMWANIGQGVQDIGVSAGQMMMGNPVGAMGGPAGGGAQGGAGAFSGAKASGSGATQPPAQSAYGPYRNGYQFPGADWYNYPGY